MSSGDFGSLILTVRPGDNIQIGSSLFEVVKFHKGAAMFRIVAPLEYDVKLYRKGKNPAPMVVVQDGKTYIKPRGPSAS